MQENTHEHEFKTGTVMDLVHETNNISKGINTLEEKVSSDINSKYYHKQRTVVREFNKIGRNDLCPCGSGKKYKNCCLKNKKYENMHELTALEVAKAKMHQLNISNVTKNL